MAHLTVADMMSRTRSSSAGAHDKVSKPMAKRKIKWIQKATENAHGQFRRKAEAAGETTREFAKEHENFPGKLGRQARLAENLMAAGRKKRRSPLYNH